MVHKVIAGLLIAGLCMAQAPIAGPVVTTGASAAIQTITGRLVNQNAPTPSSVNLAVCPANAQNFCMFNVAFAVSCSAGNAGTGGSINVTFGWSDEKVAYTTGGSSLNVQTCTAQWTTSYLSFLSHPIITAPGTSIYFFTSSAAATGPYLYDVGWQITQLQ